MSQWRAGPLVWFFAYRGEEWRVSAAYVEHADGQTSYRVIDRWIGTILSLDAALQPLLIVDHIFDWARDEYRPDILHRLTMLSDPDFGDTATIGDDSDTYSTRNHERFWTMDVQVDDDQSSSEFDELPEGIPQSLYALDSPSGVLRHASYMESRFLGLYVTADNVGSLLQTLATESDSIKFAQRLIRCLLKPARMTITGEVLNALEKLWTGDIRGSANPLSAKTKISVRVVYRTWLTAEWNQVRELCYVAVSEDGLDVLDKALGSTRRTEKARKDAVPVDRLLVETMFNRLHDALITFNQPAAISCVAYALRVVETKKKAHSGSVQLELAPRHAILQR